MQPLLKNLTTLEVGGPARDIVTVSHCEQALSHVRSARERGWPWLVLGGGSNLLVADAGFPGLVLRWDNQDFEVLEQAGSDVVVRVGGGTVWDEFVARTVQNGWAGVECLSGIPGRVGAAPIQNIGAYGQEVAETIVACHVLDMDSGEERRVEADECEFSYRMSRFKGDWKGRYLVTSVEFRLRPGGQPGVRYKELQQKMGSDTPSLAEVRETVLRIRRTKSMVWDPTDPNHRSAGSFFVNPIVSADTAQRLLAEHPAMPHWPGAGPDRVKLSAAWLIENSGFPKGFVLGPAGLSSNHVLALINRGEAQAADLLRLAARVRGGVSRQFGVDLHPEPEFVGFEQSVGDLLSAYPS